MKKILTSLSILTVLIAGAVHAVPRSHSEVLGLEVCVDAAKAEFAHRFVPGRTYFIDRDGPANTYFVNASAWQRCFAFELSFGRIFGRFAAPRHFRRCCHPCSKMLPGLTVEGRDNRFYLFDKCLGPRKLTHQILDQKNLKYLWDHLPIVRFKQCWIGTSIR